MPDQGFAEEHGDLGPVYGKQWRQWRTEDGREIDQVSEVIDKLRHDPGSRRMIIEGWNVGELPSMALPPCHKHYQFFVDPETNRLSSGLVMRSCDSFLGLPFNLANQALMTSIIAHQTGYEVGEIVWFGMDVHVYLNHMDQVKEQLERTPRALPKLVIKRKPNSLFEYTAEDFELIGYDPYPSISAPVAV